MRQHHYTGPSLELKGLDVATQKKKLERMIAIRDGRSMLAASDKPAGGSG
jgi:hypothetical protein